MNHLSRVLLLTISVVFASFACSAMAESLDVSAAQKSKIIAGLKKWRADLQFNNILATPMEGIYHVQVVGGPSIYTNSDGSYFIQGEMNKVGFGRTEKWLDKVLAPQRQKLLAQLNVDDMVVYKAEGKTKAVIHIFTDIDCHYCVKMHGEIPALTAMGVEVRYLAFPRAGMGSNSERKIKSVWCADDPAEAMNKAKSGQRVPPKSCDTNAIVDHLRLVGELGLRGTPAILLSDGTMIPGYLPAYRLRSVLRL